MSNDCEDSTNVNQPNLTIKTQGHCSTHCKLKQGKKNAITLELTVDNNTPLAYLFDVGLTSDTGETFFKNVDLPACDSVQNKEKFDFDIYQKNGQSGTKDTVTLDIEYTRRSYYCSGNTKHIDTHRSEIEYV
jgi:hypothetical protein